MITKIIKSLKGEHKSMKKESWKYQTITAEIRITFKNQFFSNYCADIWRLICELEVNFTFSLKSKYITREETKVQVVRGNGLEVLVLS